MRVLVVLVSLALVTACAAPHAARVRCDRHLVPINPPASSQGGVPSTDKHLLRSTSP
ncbi:MAG: hypothetical protein WBE92_06455 [Steroidobacteraceae bacterium]